MVDLSDLELSRPPETRYSGRREEKLSSAYLDEEGELQENYIPEVFVSEPDTHQEYPLLPRRELSNSHPEAHFEWGYTGAGPHLLSASLLADAYDDDDVALEYHGPFVQKIGDMDRSEDWDLLAKDIDDFIREIE